MRKDVVLIAAGITWCCVAAGASYAATEETEAPTAPGSESAKPGRDLRILHDGYPRAFFFRVAEGLAANAQLEYEPWEDHVERLTGIEGKVLDEEVPGRSRRNIAFFTRFKHRHPDQIVLLHYNGRARDPRDAGARYFAGHWLYHNGTNVTADVPVEAGETEISVEKPGLFKTATGRYRDRNEDIALCVLDDRGRPDWSQCEQLQLVSIDAAGKAIRVRRGCYGTRPRAFIAGKACAAAHVCTGPWGKRSNLLWAYNYSTRCPADDRGRRCADVNVAELTELFTSYGKLGAFDGIEFDVLTHACPARGGASRRGVDCDGDGQVDNGQFGGINTFALGVVEFCRKLRGALPSDKLILADGGHLGSQRCFGILNGIESEGWPWLGDWEMKDFSGGLNRHLFWQANARPPVFNYVNHKFTHAGDDPGQRVKPEVPASTHRLVFAIAQFVAAALCYSYMPSPGNDELVGIWDELWMGTEKRVGWLGQPVGPPVRLATRSPDLLEGAGQRRLGDLISRCEGGEVRLHVDGDRLRVSTPNNRLPELKFRLRDVPCAGPDLFVSVAMQGEPLADYPPEIARLAWVGIAPSEHMLVSEDLPDLGMRIRGRPETPASLESGARIEYRPHASLAREEHPSYFVHPPYRKGTGCSFWERDVRVPADARLEFFLGMGERAPGRSDGVMFRVFLAEIEEGAPPTAYVELFEHTQVEARWTHHSVPLAKWAGRKVRLRFVSDCGADDNATTDHSLWGDVRLANPAAADQATEPVRFMTWVNDRAFTSGFYFSQIKSPKVDLEFRIEGNEPLWLSDLTVHAWPDVIYREFENGLVLANPARHSCVFDLASLVPGRSYRRLRGSPSQDPVTNSGKAVSGAVTLQGREGLFLVRRDQTPP